MPIVTVPRQSDDTVKALPSLIKEAAVELSPSNPKLAEDVAGVEFGRFQIAVERTLGIGETRYGAEMAPRCCRQFAVLLDPIAIALDLRRFLLRDEAEQLRGL